MAQLALHFQNLNNHHNTNLSVQLGRLQSQLTDARRQVDILTTSLNQEKQNHYACDEALSDATSKADELDAQLRDEEAKSSNLVQRIFVLETALRVKDPDGLTPYFNGEMDQRLKETYALEQRILSLENDIRTKDEELQMYKCITGPALDAIELPAQEDSN